MRGLGLAVLGGGVVLMILACGTGESSSLEDPGPVPTEPEAGTPADAPADAPAEAAPARTLPPLPGADGADGAAEQEMPDDCTLAVENLEPRFLPEQPGGVKVAVERDNAGIIETFTMPDGTPVRSIYGGCYHVNMTETYVLEAPPADPLAAAKEVISKVARPEGEPDSLVEAVSAAKALGPQGMFECGEAVSCTIHAEGPVLEITWSFAM